MLDNLSLAKLDRDAVRKGDCHLKTALYTRKDMLMTHMHIVNHTI